MSEELQERRVPSLTWERFPRCEYTEYAIEYSDLHVRCGDETMEPLDVGERFRIDNVWQKGKAPEGLLEWVKEREARIYLAVGKKMPNYPNSWITGLVSKRLPNPTFFYGREPYLMQSVIDARVAKQLPREPMQVHRAAYSLEFWLSLEPLMIIDVVQALPDENEHWEQELTRLLDPSGNHENWRDYVIGKVGEQ